MIFWPPRCILHLDISFINKAKLWSILKLQCWVLSLLRNLYAIQEATVRTRHETKDWFKIGKGVQQGCILLPCLFNFYAEYKMLNARLDELRAGIKVPRRNINNLRYAYDTTVMAKCERNLMRVKEESEKVDLKLNIQKTKIMVSSPITLWQIEEEKLETVADFIFWGSKITMDADCIHGIKRCLLLRRKAMANLDSIQKTETSLCWQMSVYSKLWFFQ